RVLDDLVPDALDLHLDQSDPEDVHRRPEYGGHDGDDAQDELAHDPPGTTPLRPHGTPQPLGPAGIRSPGTHAAGAQARTRCRPGPSSRRSPGRPTSATTPTGTSTSAATPRLSSCHHRTASRPCGVVTCPDADASRSVTAGATRARRHPGCSGARPATPE